MVGRASGLPRAAVTALGLSLAFLGCGGGYSRAPRAYVTPPPRMYAPLDPRTSAVIGFAEAQVGKRYCWGGNGPKCFDCSGLVQAAWRWGGIALPRTSDAQGRALFEVPIEDVRAGDILWWRGHVGLYVGNGEMIDAYHSGAGVVRRRAVVPERVLRVLVSPS
ncbi:putative secreted protein [Labilithrix luteola]|uniref:Putative secreted protein n=1 Tax=Labilithrix luteola TaxID=1391654 RepID=A0A0K1PM20_9BACT|nr:NlpC/P60 family protein [Labilithrix luteola]AKU94570.1 putative secreted protein [Labilithrix luteola]